MGRDESYIEILLTKKMFMFNVSGFKGGLVQQIRCNSDCVFPVSTNDASYS